ncbi:methenyltetrahydrofolate cyclohydrolase [Ferrovum sp. PN-J185]|nr:cyclodeaminase/cyclohydrolase family protein [Ferrovum sp. PN-J185]KXW56837.1 methenyltetrahydrofolate cyclohydrolase [Ferrovum sp. PN-J185]
MMIENQTLQSFLSDLASAKPTPGGGGAAAVSGAMGAALISMVANLTIGKKGYESVENEMNEQLTQSENLRKIFISLIDEDINTFNQLMSAYKLPKDTDEQKLERSATIQLRLKDATLTPLSIAKTALEGILLAQRSAQFGNTMVISDAGVAVEMLLSALKSAALNVFINAPSIKDHTFKEVALKEIDELMIRGSSIAEQVFENVKDKLKS